MLASETIPSRAMSEGGSTSSQRTQAYSSIEVTVLMPCLNEVRTLAICIEKATKFFERFGVHGEVLIADNGSTDGSQDLARSMGARVIEVPVRGYGAALSAGIHAAHGTYVIMGDSDDSYDFSSLDVFVEKLREGSELVMGNRFSGGIAAGAMPWHHRYIGNPVLSFIGRTFFGSPIGDFHCGLRGFHRDAVEKLGLASQGMEFASEMIVKATLAGLRVSEVPTTLSPDGRDRPPHLRSFRDGWRHLRFLLLHCPRWLFLYPGLLLLSAGAVVQALLFPGPLVLGSVAFDVHTMLFAAAASVLGAQAALFWALGNVAAVRIGVLPRLPSSLQWTNNVRLEYGLIVGAVIVVVGIGWGLVAILTWAEVGFSAVDPSRVMRSAIPSTTLMILGVQVLIASFFLSLLRLDANRYWRDANFSILP